MPKVNKEKNKDFQKPKLKVGKEKPKPSNHTDTSFRTRSVSVLQHSLSNSAKTPAAQFAHELSLCRHKSVPRRIEALTRLTTILEAVRPPQPLSTFLPKVAPLILDLSPAVRAQLLKLFRLLPQQDIQEQSQQILLYVRAGMSSLASGIQLSALEAMEWLLDSASLQLVTTRDGWLGTLQTFRSLLRWDSESSNASTGNTVEQVKVTAKGLRVLALFLTAGLTQIHDVASVQAEQARRTFPFTNFSNLIISRDLDASASLRLMTASTADNDKTRHLNAGDRQTAFEDQHGKSLEKALKSAKREGGAIGREASSCLHALKLCRDNYLAVTVYENIMQRLRRKSLRRMRRDAESRVGDEEDISDTTGESEMGVESSEIGKRQELVSGIGYGLA